MTPPSPSPLESVLGHRFSDPELLRLALTHPSCERVRGDNQRLEFIGDAVLDLVIAETLFCRFPGENEGTLDRFRASLVNGQAIARAAANIGLGNQIEVGKAQRKHHPEPSERMLEDALEAIIGAVFLDGGLDAAREVVQTVFAAPLAACESGEAASAHNPKGRLQEWSQRHYEGATPLYEELDAQGPDHDRLYKARVSLGSRILAEGSGRSKKAAESDAARNALRGIR